MTVKFATVMGNSTLASKPFYVGIPQHERTMTKKETYAYCAERTGYKPTQVRAVFMALRQYLKENANRGNVTYLDDVGSTVYLTDRLGVTYEVVVDEVISKQLFKGHTAALLEPGEYKLVVKSRAGDAEGPLQTAFRRVKYLKVAPPGPKITKIQGDDEPTPAGEINEGRPFTITGERLAGATATWSCVYEGTEHSGEVRVNSSSETEMKCGGIVPVDGTIDFGDITITVTTADGSATVTAKTGA